MTYLGYENLQTGVFSLVQTNINIKEFYTFVKNEVKDPSLPNMVDELIVLMEDSKNRKDKDVVLFLLGIMLLNYIKSGVQIKDENFLWFRTNGDRFHTIGKKLWKGAKTEDVEKFFKRQLKKDYDGVYQEW